LQPSGTAGGGTGKFVGDAPGFFRRAGGAAASFAGFFLFPGGGPARRQKGGPGAFTKGGKRVGGAQLFSVGRRGGPGGGGRAQKILASGAIFQGGGGGGGPWIGGWGGVRGGGACFPLVFGKNEPLEWGAWFRGREILVRGGGTGFIFVNSISGNTKKQPRPRGGRNDLGGASFSGRGKKKKKPGGGGGWPGAWVRGLGRQTPGRKTWEIPGGGKPGGRGIFSRGLGTGKGPRGGGARPGAWGLAGLFVFGGDFSLRAKGKRFDPRGERRVCRRTPEPEKIVSQTLGF